jgi:hypothetical protein
VTLLDRHLTWIRFNAACRIYGTEKVKAVTVTINHVIVSNQGSALCQFEPRARRYQNVGSVCTSQVRTSHVLPIELRRRVSIDVEALCLIVNRLMLFTVRYFADDSSLEDSYPRRSNSASDWFRAEHKLCSMFDSGCCFLRSRSCAAGECGVTCVLDFRAPLFVVPAPPSGCCCC